MKNYILYRIWNTMNVPEYNVMEESEYSLEKQIDRDLCYQTISFSSDKKALEMACKEFNNLGILIETIDKN